MASNKVKIVGAFSILLTCLLFYTVFQYVSNASNGEENISRDEDQYWHEFQALIHRNSKLHHDIDLSVAMANSILLDDPDFSNLVYCSAEKERDYHTPKVPAYPLTDAELRFPSDDPQVTDLHCSVPLRRFARYTPLSPTVRNLLKSCEDYLYFMHNSWTDWCGERSSWTPPKDTTKLDTRFVNSNGPQTEYLNVYKIKDAIIYKMAVITDKYIYKHSEFDGLAPNLCCRENTAPDRVSEELKSINMYTDYQLTTPVMFNGRILGNAFKRIQFTGDTPVNRADYASFLEKAPVIKHGIATYTPWYSGYWHYNFEMFPHILFMRPLIEKFKHDMKFLVQLNNQYYAQVSQQVGFVQEENRYPNDMLIKVQELYAIQDHPAKVTIQTHYELLKLYRHNMCKTKGGSYYSYTDKNLLPPSVEQSNKLFAQEVKLKRELYKQLSAELMFPFAQKPGVPATASTTGENLNLKRVHILLSQHGVGNRKVDYSFLTQMLETEFADKVAFFEMEHGHFSLEYQTRLFEEVDIVVTPQGSSTGNILCSKVGTDLIVLTPALHTDLFLWNSASAMGSRYYHFTLQYNVHSAPPELVLSPLEREQLKAIVRHAIGLHWNLKQRIAKLV